MKQEDAPPVLLTFKWSDQHFTVFTKETGYSPFPGDLIREIGLYTVKTAAYPAVFYSDF